MAKKLGAAVIGTGWVSSEHIRAFVLNPRTEMRMICGSSEARAREKLAMGNADPSVPFTTDYRDVLASRDIDVISIANRPDLHPQLAVDAAKAGKHMIIEKPVALNLRDLYRMQDAVRKARVRTVVSFVLRWNPLFEIITALLNENAIGELYYGEADYYHAIGPWYRQYVWNVTRKSGGNSLLSAGIHAVDGLRCFMRKEVVEVKAYSTRSNGAVFEPYEYDPTSVTIIRFDDGSVGKVAASLECVCPYIFNIALFGAQGTIINNKLWSRKLMPGQKNFSEIPTILPDSGDVTHHPFEGEINHFVECVVERKESHVNLDDAVKTHEVCFAMEKSAQTGRAVRLPLKKGGC